MRVEKSEFQFFFIALARAGLITKHTVWIYFGVDQSVH